MANPVKVLQSEIDIARSGLNIQFTSMFDEPTRKTMDDLGIQKFLDHLVTVEASNQALIRFYSNLVHLTPKDS